MLEEYFSCEHCPFKEGGHSLFGIMAQHGEVDERGPVVEVALLSLGCVGLIEDQPGQLLAPRGPTLGKEKHNALVQK